MPTYDYVCEACGHEFEHFQSMTDKHLKTCPKCKKRKLVRKIGAGAGLIFKGTGFYQTDYKTPASSAPAAKAESKPAEPAAAASTTSDASAPAKTADSTAGKAPAKAAEPKAAGSTKGGKA